MGNKLTGKNKPKSEGLSVSTLKPINDVKPSISITYLDNNYNFKHLFKVSKGNSDYLNILHQFLDKARCYANIDELINNHKPHKKLKNLDHKSVLKMKSIQNEFNIETKEMIHLHCCRDGNGEFVLHGFRINNRFEIVWIDPKHDIHK